MLTTTSTGLSVSRNTGASSARSSAVRSDAVDRRRRRRGSRAARSSAAISPASDLSPLAARLLAVEPALDRREVGEHELELERVEVAARVGVAGDRRVLERPQHEEDGVAVAERAEEPVAQPLAACSRPSPARRCRRSRSRCTRASSSATSRRGGRPARRARARCRPWSRWWRTGAAATTVDAPVERVEQARLAAVGEADEAETFHAVAGYRAALRAVAVGAGRGSSTTDSTAASTAPRGDVHEQEDQQAEAALPAQQGQPRQAAELRPSLGRASLLAR